MEATSTWITPTHLGHFYCYRVDIRWSESSTLNCYVRIRTYTIMLQQCELKSPYTEAVVHWCMSHTCSRNLYIFSCRKINHHGALLHALILCLCLNDAPCAPNNIKCIKILKINHKVWLVKLENWFLSSIIILNHFKYAFSVKWSF